MRPYSYLGIFLFAVLILTSCTQHYPYPATDLTQEYWQYSVQTAPESWKKGADAWFLRAEPSKTEIRNRFATTDKAISTMHVGVPNFDRIKVDGRFQVQIFGTDEQNSVDVYGPNAGVRALSIAVKDGLLSVTQVIPAPGDIEKVIVRIGVRNLHQLIQCGCGKIEGISINSDHLIINSNPGGNGDIYLNGKIRLKQVVQYGSGKITLFNVYASDLEIYTAGFGILNIHGRVGLRTISDYYGGDINIIGGCGHNVKIFTTGNGKIGIRGEVGLSEIIASRDTQTYVCLVNSPLLRVFLSGNADVGLAGKVGQLEVKATDSATFQGRFLEARTARVAAEYKSHINVTAQDEAFAQANGLGSIYYFGPPDRLAPFIRNKGSIIPIGYDPIYGPPVGLVVSKPGVVNVRAKS